MKKKAKIDEDRQIRPCRTYRDGRAWVTPMGKYNIVHEDWPSDEEIKQRARDEIKEIIHGEGFEDDCPLCQMMKDKPYNIVYYCQQPCQECAKARVCPNFDSNSKKF